MPEPAPKTADLTDFPDRFSPMLVKELRQGLRTNLFVTAFILLQGFMILCILMNSADSNSNSTATAFFWFFIVVALVVVQPLRGFASLSAEYNLNTMDLIQLTRLDAWRITWGKWCAINAQTLLLVAAVAPYLVLRYFFGSVNIFADLGILGLCAVGSALLSAMTVGCSAFKNLVVRMALLVLCGFVFVLLWAYTTQELIRGTISPSEMKELTLIIFACLFGTFFFLSFGASKIAPGSENHSTLKRLVGLGFAIGAWAFQFWGTDEEVCNVISSIILGLTMLDAITEQPPVFGSVLKPFSSPLKRPLAYFLTPGWHTGILFYCVVSLAFWTPTMLHYFNFRTSMDELGMIFYGAGMLTFPLILIHLFFRKSSMPHFALYLFIQACLTVVTILTVAVAESSPLDEEIVYLFIAIPSILFFGNLDSNLDSPVFVLIGFLWLALGVLIPLISGMKLYQQMRTAFKSFKKPAADT